MTILKTIRLASASLATLVLSSQIAQAEPSPDATDNSSAATPQMPSWVSEVVVTSERARYAAPVSASATRTDTPLTQVPQSVEVLTATLIREQDAHSLTDALVNVSGVIPTKPQEDLFTGPIVRGFPAEVYVDGQWRLVDATGMAPLDGLVRASTGLDAADIAFMTIFGSATLLEQSFSVSEPGATPDLAAA